MYAMVAAASIVFRASPRERHQKTCLKFAQAPTVAAQSCPISTKHWTSRARFSPNCVFMQDLGIRGAAMRAYWFLCRFRMIVRLSGVGPAALCRRSSLRHLREGASRQPQTRVRRISDITIQFIRTNIWSSPFLVWLLISSNVVQGFDLSGSWQLVREPSCSAGLFTETTW